ncbi:MAG: hypothetical protein COX36_03570 [Candidatus Nealsonbacteria bacterium CG23_combo_of_CG06-09_8_20_14_all_38_19]|uniref:Uncharacterized protein n=1 Tax=Candidatus Nealsonbacteria bacterium CG23_combo_of_CG06-09_8_20_14_all_38_19 TaxID=1974721 RepID=A0A2G9YW06_9BACT|nr:MAG: hypothetical protein COX36_03570 [Candidatus Nealsonbacteria bacterium CG23_combo_of_CG06-09_8_20_14_all_38_19]
MPKSGVPSISVGGRGLHVEVGQIVEVLPSISVSVAESKSVDAGLITVETIIRIAEHNENKTIFCFSILSLLLLIFFRICLSIVLLFNYSIFKVPLLLSNNKKPSLNKRAIGKI